MAIKPAKRKRASAAKQTAWKGKTPTERRRLKSRERSEADTIGFATVSVKMRPAEKAELKRVCEKLGITPNRAMRIMARQASGFLEIRNQSLGNLETITQQIIGISRNINQIAKAGNRTLSPDFIAFMEDRAELSKELRSLQRLLLRITNTARRRTDGMRALKEASETS